MSKFIHEVICKPLKCVLRSLDKDQEVQILITGLNTDFLIHVFSIKLRYPDFDANASATTFVHILSHGVTVLVKGNDRLLEYS